MTQQAKKSASNHASKPTSSTKFRPVEVVQGAEKKAWEMGRGNMENVVRTADTFNGMAGELASICSDNLSALTECSSKASQVYQEFGTEVMESCNRTFSDLAEITQEAFACRTLSDMVELQNKVVQQMFDNYFTTANKLSAMLFDSCEEVLEPLGECSAKASEKMCKAMAA
jgi:hypothetical protein